jgi:hypothetical protein
MTEARFGRLNVADGDEEGDGRRKANQPSSGESEGREQRGRLVGDLDGIRYGRW